VTPDDFKLPPLPDSENAAEYYRKAALAITQPADSRVGVSDVCGELSDPAVWGEFERDVARLIAANREALRLARAARSLPGANWNVAVSPAAFPGLVPELGAQRNVARLLVTAAEYHHRAGDHGASVETLRDALAHTEGFGRLRGYYIVTLNVVAIDALATSAMEDIFPSLAVTTLGQSPQAGIAPATREQAEALLADLLDDRFLAENWRWAMCGERVLMLERAVGPPWLPWVGAGPTPTVVARILQPASALDAVRLAEHYTRMTGAAEAGTYREAIGNIGETGAWGPAYQTLAHPLSGNRLPATGVMLFFRARMSRRLAATALAIRLYELDHGRRPDALDELVPDYLPAVPIDLFAQESRPIVYLPGAPRPLLYSVGPDGRDDAGSYDVEADGGFAERPKDLLFFLNGDRPRPASYLLRRLAAASQATQDDGDEVGDGAGDDEDEGTDEEPK